MPQQSYTVEQLRQMGAKPRSYSLQELQQMGAKPAVSATPAPDPNQAVKDRQAAQFPTSAEMGGTPGAMVQPQNLEPTWQDTMAANMGQVWPGVKKAVTGIPAFVGSAVSAVGNPGKQVELLKGAAHGIADPFATSITGAAALAAPDKFQAPTDEEFLQASEGAGTQLGGAIMQPIGAKVVKQVPPTLRKLGNMVTTAEAQQARANVNTAKSLRPTTLEGQAVTQKIAPEMSKRQIRGTGNQIDKKLITGLNDATTKLAAEESRMASAPQTTTIAMTPLIGKVNAAIDALKVKGTNRAVNTQAVTALEEIRDLFQELPETAAFDQVLDLRRKLDAAVDDAGGFSQTSSAADRTTMKARRGGANIARAALNELDEAFKKANRDYSFHRNAVDVVQRRQLGEVGKTGSGLPGRGSILDDILAGWAGEAIGGTPGVIAIEGLNLARQSRAWSSAKASVQQKAANALTVKPVRSTPSNPTAPAPAPPVSPTPAGSTPPASQPGYVVTSGPAKGMIYWGKEVSEGTGNTRYLYKVKGGEKITPFASRQQ